MLDRAPQRRRARSQRLRAWSPKDVDSTVSWSAGILSPERGPSHPLRAARHTLVGGGLLIPSSLLITGATGMIGSLLTDALIAEGVEFSVMLRPGDPGDRIAGKPGVSSTEGD